MIVLYQMGQQSLIAYVLDCLRGWQIKLLDTDLVELRCTVIYRILERAWLVTMCRNVKLQGINRL